MKLKYLGTAAAEGIPGLFCNCKICQNALQKRGKEVKTRSQSLVDGKLLIDFPADTYLHVLNYGLDLRDIHHCIITHSHSDHFYPRDFWCRGVSIANDISDEPFNVYMTEAAYDEAIGRYGDTGYNGRLNFHKISPFVPFDIEEYHIIPLEADHDPSAFPVIYIIETAEKSLFYANDTGVFPEKTWDYLKTYTRKFDLISLDCTGMALKNGKNHMALSSDKEVCDRLLEMGLIDDKTVRYVNHFSHNGLLTHEELVIEAEKLGFLASYDGLEVEF